MRFKIWLNEIVELQKPTSKIRKSTFIKNKGTNTAKPILQYAWKTSFGNTIKLQLDKKWDDSYDVVFYVNDTHHDDETATDARVRDPEVLNSVLYTIKKKADELGIKELTFKAQNSPKDYKKIFNLPLEPIRTQLLEAMQNLLSFVSNRQTKYIPPTQSQIDLATKFNYPRPAAKPDFDPKWIKIIQNSIKEINENNKISAYFDFLQEENSSRNNFKNIGYNITVLVQQIKKYNEIVESRSPEGWQRYRNRRAEVYDKLLRKFFADWDIKRDGNYFTLTNSGQK